MSASLDTIQCTSMMMEFTASASEVQTPRNSQGSLPEPQRPEYLQQILSLELGHQERHLAWRFEVAYAMGDMDQVEDDVNMAFLTRFINHQLLHPTTLQERRLNNILAGTTHKRS